MKIYLKKTTEINFTPSIELAKTKKKTLNHIVDKIIK